MNWKKRKRAVSAIAIALALMCTAQEMLCMVRAQAAELPPAESVSELTEKYEKALESADAAISDAQIEDESAREGESSGVLPGKSKDKGISDAERARSGEEELGVGTSGESVRYAGKKPKINKKSLKLTVGESATLKVSGTSKKVKWASSNKKVASVSAKGVVTAKKAGTAKITAKVAGNKLICNVTVAGPDYQAARKKLKNYILKYGGPMSDDTMAIDRSRDLEYEWIDEWEKQKSCIAIIEYNSSEDAFCFRLSHRYDDYDVPSPPSPGMHIVEMKLPLADTSGKLLVKYEEMGFDPEEFMLCAEIEQDKYNNKTMESFTITSQIDPDLNSNYAIRQRFQLAMQEWDSYLREEVGISMKDIGFSSF